MSDPDLPELRSVLLSGLTPAHRGVLFCQGLHPWRPYLTSGDGSCTAVGYEFLEKSGDTFHQPPLVQGSHTCLEESGGGQDLPLASHEWRNSRGPGRRMPLSLDRTGWEAREFHLWQDDRGHPLDLMHTSPVRLACKDLTRDDSRRQPPPRWRSCLG